MSPCKPIGLYHSKASVHYRRYDPKISRTGEIRASNEYYIIAFFFNENVTLSGMPHSCDSHRLSKAGAETTFGFDRALPFPDMLY